MAGTAAPTRRLRSAGMSGRWHCAIRCCWPSNGAPSDRSFRGPAVAGLGIGPRPRGPEWQASTFDTRKRGPAHRRVAGELIGPGCGARTRRLRGKALFASKVRSISPKPGSPTADVDRPDREARFRRQGHATARLAVRRRDAGRCRKVVRINEGGSRGRPPHRRGSYGRRSRSFRTVPGDGILSVAMAAYENARPTIRALTSRIG